MSHRSWRPLIAIVLLVASGFWTAWEVARSGEAPPGSAASEARPSYCEPLFEANRARWPAELSGALEAARSLYVLGVCHLEIAKYREAERYFELGLETAPGLGPHWRLKLFQAAMDGDNRTARALTLLNSLLEAQPPPELVERLRNLLSGRREIASEESAEADYQYLGAFFARVEPAPEDYDLLLYLRELAGRFDNAKLRWKARVMLWQVPRDEQTALEGARSLRRPRLKGAYYLRRVRNLYRLRLFPQLIKELEAPGLPRWAGEPARKMGSYYFLSLIREKKYLRAALQIVNPRVVERFALARRDVLRIAVQVNLRRRTIPKAIRRIRELEALDAAEENLPRFHLEVARYYEQKRNLRAMIAWCRRVLRKYSSQPEAAMAYWLPIWNYYVRGDHPRAVAWSERAIANTESFGAETRSRYYYWRARSLMAQGKEEQGRQAWQDLQKLWPTTYYGLMARRADGEGPEPPRFTLGERKPGPAPKPPALKAIWEVPPLRAALFLFVVGEEEQAAGMMGRVLGEPMADGLLNELGEVFKYFNRFRLQYRITANYFYSELKRRPVSDSPIWRHAYPKAFWEHVLEQTSSQQVSPFFVLAVMREESNFHAAADSRAGAKGLMQLMPSTARMVARRNRLPYDEAALTRPGFNITLGTLYLKGVLKRNKWNPVLAAASYNAGPNAVRKWRRKFRGLPIDEFVESIPYDETRGYVKRVISSYLIYRELYHPSAASGRSSDGATPPSNSP